MIDSERVKKQTKPKAPYATTHCRVPVPIKPMVEAIVREWRVQAWAEARQRRRPNP